MVNPTVHNPASRHGHEISHVSKRPQLLSRHLTLTLQQALELEASIQGHQSSAAPPSIYIHDNEKLLHYSQFCD